MVGVGGRLRGGGELRAGSAAQSTRSKTEISVYGNFIAGISTGPGRTPPPPRTYYGNLFGFGVLTPVSRNPS